MSPNVKTKFETVCSYPFFQSVGRPLPLSVTPVLSWPAASGECHSLKWRNSKLMARNTLFRMVQEKSWTRRQEWGPLSDELRPLILSFVDGLLPKFPLQGKALKNIRDSLSWDIMLICFEEEYKDLTVPFFYIPVVEPWYAAGHLPCGWDGDEFPEGWDGVVQGGQLMVF